MKNSAEGIKNKDVRIDILENGRKMKETRKGFGNLIAKGSGLLEDKGLYYTNRTYTVESRCSYSLTWPFNWTSVLVLVYTHRCEIKLLTEVYPVLRYCELYEQMFKIFCFL